MLITDGTGMTGVVNKFQHILGLKGVPENLKILSLFLQRKPIVFILTHGAPF
jgi:hypothetical protein